MILIAGGECNSGKLFTEHEGFNVKTGRWSRFAPMASPRHGIQAADRRTHGVHPRRRTGVRNRGVGHVADVQVLKLQVKGVKGQRSKWE